MLAYNAEPFIEKAIEGVLRQETDFPFELVIGEDKSTDRTHEICLKYAERFPGRVRVLAATENLRQARNYVRTWSHCRGHYIANCDGDDVWVDDTKLQRQVDILESNPDLGLSYTDIRLILDDDSDSPSDEWTEVRSRYSDGWVFFRLLDGNFINHSTAVFRRSLLRGFNERNDVCMDYLLWLHIAMRTKIHFLPAVTTAYRLHEGGITSSRGRVSENQSTLLESIQSVVNEFGDAYAGPMNEFDRRLLVRKLLSFAVRLPSFRRKWEALRLLRQLRPGWRTLGGVAARRLNKANGSDATPVATDT